MKSIAKTIFKAFLFSLLISIPVMAYAEIGKGKSSIADMVILLIAFFMIISLSLFVFLLGTKSGKKENEPVFLMAAIGVKFFLSAVFALIYFISLKNTSLEYIILFFLLYLAFTFYLLRVMLRNLKVRSLKQQ